MDVRKTKHYYDVSAGDNVCTCDYCRNYVNEIRHAYPELSEYLKTMGIDIEKPFETMPIEPDESGHITYIGSQYVVRYLGCSYRYCGFSSDDRYTG